ncbi:G domain-containing protein [Favolaschia claudopus]|uniref:G domain-containing protein n=1 Tax=Favolaschia claudopus TaxID=2862362 RepID=A0AAW0BK77_9AGAR
MAGGGTLPLETDKILAKCPKLRVLVVGKSGTGKSSLINHVFGIKQQVVSHQARGVCNIHDEITSPDNPRLILHDSMGFEPGQVTNLENAIAFLEARSAENIAIQDQVHVVWLCIKIPHAGGRVLETGDEKLIEFALHQKVPLIIVFTQFDKLKSLVEQELTDEEMDSDECDENVTQRSATKFVEICLRPLERFNSVRYAQTSGLTEGMHVDRAALRLLVEATQDMVKENVWFVTAVAQRTSARAKVDSSINILIVFHASGSNSLGYWLGLASTTKLFGSPLQTCLKTIHFEITASWNFNDPDELLTNDTFKQKLYSLIQFVVPEDKEIRTWFDNVDPFQALIGIGTAITAAAAPIFVAIGLSTMFMKWIRAVYNETPEALRCLMAYICDLTLIMDHLFLETLDVPPPRRLTQAHIDSAVQSYQTSSAAKVHTELRMYANRATFAQIVQSNKAEHKVKDIIDSYCSK